MKVPATPFLSDFGPLRRLCVRSAAFAVLTIVVGSTAGQYFAAKAVDFRTIGMHALVPLIVAVALAALFYALLPRFPVWVLPEGLRGYDFFGRYRLVQWSEIRAARPLTIFGLPYLAIHAESISSPITLPLWLRDRVGFDALVAARAGDVNPLTLALRGPAAMLADVTMDCYYLEATGGAPEVATTAELPAELADGERLSKSLVVCAVRKQDGIVVGMGAGWVFRRQTGDLLLLVKAAEVNEPYEATELRRQLIDALTVFGKADGVSAVYLSKDLGNG